MPKKAQKGKSGERRHSDYDLSPGEVQKWIQNRIKEGFRVRKMVLADVAYRSMGLLGVYAAQRVRDMTQEGMGQEDLPLLDLTQKGGPKLIQPETEYPWGRLLIAHASIFDLLEDSGIYRKKVKSVDLVKRMRLCMASLMHRDHWTLSNEDCGYLIPYEDTRWIIEKQLGTSTTLNTLSTSLYGYSLGRVHERGLGVKEPLVFQQSARDKLRIRIDRSFDPHEEFEKRVTKFVARKIKGYERNPKAKAFISGYRGWKLLAPREQYWRLYAICQGKSKKKKSKEESSDSESESDLESSGSESESDYESEPEIIRVKSKKGVLDPKKPRDLGPSGIPTKSEKTIRYRVNKLYAVRNGTFWARSEAPEEDKKHRKSFLAFLDREQKERGVKSDDAFDLLLHAMFFASDHWAVHDRATRSYHKYVTQFEAAGKDKGKNKRPSESHEEVPDPHEKPCKRSKVAGPNDDL